MTTARRFRVPALLVALVAPLVAMAADVPAPGPVPAAGEASRRLNDLFKRYFEEYLELHPVSATYIGDNRYNDRIANDLGPEWRARWHAVNERYLADVRRIDPATLGREDRVSWEVFVRERTRQIESERFPDYLLPVDQHGGLATLMPMLGSGSNAQPFATTRDYEAWLGRLDGFPVWVDQAIANMREGVQRGVVQPRVVMERLLPQLDDMLVAKPEDSLFWTPAANFPEGVPAADRPRLEAAYRRAIAEQVLPAYRRLRDYVRDEYLPKCRTTIAWTALPDGQAWYQFYVSEHTTTDMGAQQIHEIGVAEVRRILGEMNGVRRTVGFQGDLPAFFDHLETDPRFYFTNGADLIEGFRVLKQRIDAALPKLFSVFPKADYEIREVEAPTTSEEVKIRTIFTW